MREACKTVSPAERVQEGFLVVGGSSGSRDVIYASPKVGVLGERLSRAREDATIGAAMSSRERHSKRTSCEDHENSVVSLVWEKGSDHLTVGLRST